MIKTHEEWLDWIFEDDEAREIRRKLPEDWTVYPLRTMPQIKCFRCRQFLMPGANYYGAGELVVHQACGDMLAPPSEPDTPGPS